MGADGRRRSIMVNIPFVEQQGQPQAVPPGTPGAEVIDLKAGDLSVTAVVGKSYATRREETADALSAIMQAAPSLAPILAPFWLDELDFPGAKKLAAIAKKTLPPQFQEDETGQPNPAQLQQQLVQASQMIDLLTKELQAKTQIIETDTIKADAQVQVTQLELASKERIESLKAQVDLLKADVSAQTALQQTQLGAQAGTDRVLWQNVARSVAQLDQQAFQKDQQAAQQQAERDAQQAALAQPQGPPQGGGPGAGGPPGATPGPMAPGPTGI
jgi:hypothetical protein